MAALTALMTRFCAGEDSWLARSTNTANETGPSEAKSSTGKLNVEHKGQDTPSEDEDEPRKQSTGEQKKFPPEVKTVNVLHVMKGRTPRDTCPRAYHRGVLPLVVPTDHL